MGTDSLSHCRNCGAALRGEYCADCGQREGSGDERFLDVARDLASDLIEIDSRFWRTFYPLVLRPGRLSAEYFAGRRARYLPPLRLYLVLSFCLFLYFSFAASSGLGPGPIIITDQSDDEEIALQVEEAVNAASKARVASESGKTTESGDYGTYGGYEEYGEAGRAAGDKVRKGLDEARAAREASDPNDLNIELGFSNENSPQWMQELEQDLEERMKENVAGLREDPRPLVNAMLDFGPQMMFILLPLFALLVQCAYLFSPYHYLQHLVFALHYHSFAYILYLLDVVLERAWEGAGGLLVLWMLVYLPLALRRAYGSSWGGAIGKTLFIYLSYGLMMLAGFVVVAITALLML